MQCVKSQDGIPAEIEDKLSKFDHSISEVEDLFKIFQNKPITELQTKLPALDKAKLDLLGAYTINSLFWVYLTTRGDNPKEHGIKQELDRVKTYMGRVKEIEDKAKAPRINTSAVKRFVRNALWQQAHEKTADQTFPDAAKAETVSTQKSAETVSAPNATETVSTSEGASSYSTTHQQGFATKKQKLDKRENNSAKRPRTKKRKQ